MKKLATTLALALAFAAPMTFSISAVQAKTVKSQSHVTKSASGKRHQAKNHTNTRSARGQHKTQHSAHH